MREKIVGFNELNEEQQWLATENHRNARYFQASCEREEDRKRIEEEYDAMTEDEWMEIAADYSYVVTYFDDNSYEIQCLF